MRPTALFITRKWAPAVGGMETYSRELTAMLSRYVELTIFSLAGRSNGRTPNGLSIFWFGFRAAGLLLAKARRFQVVHVGDMAMWPLGWLANLCNPAARVVISAHGTDVVYANRSGLKPLAYRKYLRLGAKCLAQAEIIANSDATCKALARHGFQSAAIIPLAARPSKVPRGNQENYRSPHSEKFILFSGRLTQQKGCGWFIKNVLPELPKDIILYVAGVVIDPAENIILNNPRVHFLGPVDPMHLASLRHSALAVIAPNIKSSQAAFEGFGLAATEGAADGGVVIAADLFGLQAAVIDQVTGFLVEPGNPVAWRKKIFEINSWSAKERADFIAKAKDAVCAHFSWERVAKQTLEVYGVGVSKDLLKEAA